MDADSLRAEFDGGFARPPELHAAEEFVQLLRIEVAEALYALPLQELSGAFVLKSLLPLPGAPPALLGLAGFRGTVVPIYSLATLLGLEESRPPACAALLHQNQLGLAFSSLRGQLRVLSTSLQIRPGFGSLIRALAEASLPVLDTRELRSLVEQLVETRKEAHG